MGKRTPIIIIGVLIVVVLASPFALGMLAESNVRGEIDVLNDYPPASIEVVSYDRGWFESQAQIEVRPAAEYIQMITGGDPMMAAMISQFSLPFDVEIAHGPIQTKNGFGIGSYDVVARLNTEAPWAQQVMTTLGVPYLFELRGRSGFGPGFRFEGEIPPFDVTEDGSTVTFSGLDFTGNTDGEHLLFDASLDSVEMQSALLSFILEGIAVHSDSQFKLNGMGLGTGEVVLGSFVASQPLLGAEPMAAVRDLRVGGTTAMNAAGNYDMELLYSLGELQAQDIPAISDAALGIKLGNLDAMAVDQFYASMSDMYSGADPEMIVMSMAPLAGEILAGSPTIAIDPIRFSMDGERATGTINISINADALPTGQITDFMDPDTVMAAVRADLDLTISKALMRQIMSMSLEQQLRPELEGMTELQIQALVDQQVEQMSAMVVGMGMLADSGDDYTTTIVYENGTATVNGTAMPLNALGF